MPWLDCHRRWMLPGWAGLWPALIWALAWCAAPAARAETAPTVATSASATEAPLLIGHRTVHVFRAQFGEFTPADRAQKARQRILRALEGPGAGWTSVSPQGDGVMVELDGKAMFLVLPGDAPLAGQGAGGGAGAGTGVGAVAAASLANQASRVLQTVWAESREQHNPRALVEGAGKVLLALLLLAAALTGVWRLTRWLRDRFIARWGAGLRLSANDTLNAQFSPLLLGLATRGCVLLAWLVSLALAFITLTYSLGQFPYTRTASEELLGALAGLLLQSLGAVATALPGMFVAALIFLVAWVATQVTAEVFRNVASGRLKLGMLDQHTAPTTRYIVNACLWLFALAMAYPYLPGAQTEAFKGLSVLLGVMVSLGASGLVGQVASGMILVYTRALSIGEYVRIQDCEGTVTEIGLFVTRLRNGTGTEFALPNALVLGNATRNLSRQAGGRGFMLETTVTIGYDTPWRQVHALLTHAAESVDDIARDPAPFVVQTALQDAYVAYRLVAVVQSDKPKARAHAISQLHAAIQDSFNRYGVQIMSPNYITDPALPKVVAEADWYTAPARRDEQA